MHSRPDTLYQNRAGEWTSSIYLQLTLSSLLPLCRTQQSKGKSADSLYITQLRFACSTADVSEHAGRMHCATRGKIDTQLENSRNQVPCLNGHRQFPLPIHSRTHFSIIAFTSTSRWLVKSPRNCGETSSCTMRVLLKRGSHESIPHD